jgi:hypothetical protein
LFIREINADSSPDETSSPPSRHLVLKRFHLEPWLVLGSPILWLLVLPFAGPLWSGTLLARRTDPHC